MPPQPFLDSLARQNEMTMRDLPSRLLSVTFGFGGGLFFAAFGPMAAVFMAYLAIEAVGILSIRRLDRGFSKPAYILQFLACLTGSLTTMIMPVLAWTHPSTAAHIYGFVMCFGTVLHVIVVRSYHMPFTLAIIGPVIATGLAVTVAELRSEPDIVLRGVGFGVAALLCFYAMQAIFEMHRMRQSIVRAKDRAEAANRSKSRFVTSMSHEIRTPLNGILGIAQLEIEDADTEQRRDRADILLSSATALRALVDDVLDHAKIEAGKMEIRPTAIDPVQLADTVMRLFHDLAHRKGLTLTLDIAPTLPRLIVGDALRLRQIMSNLISNAIKFTDHGEVRLALGIEAAGAGGGFWFSVGDTGPGMTTEDQACLFRSFSQVDADDERAAAGTGLGLAISRSLARMMDGDLTVRSSPGVGSTFRFSMPLSLPDPLPSAPLVTPGPAQANAVAALSLTAQRVLLVDDNRANRLIARAFMEKAQIDVTEADGGRAALAQIANRTFDLVLLDMHMPDMDGLATLRHIRRATHVSGHLPVIALTADAAPEDRAHYMAAGLDGYLAKPLGKDDMFREIGRVLRQRATGIMAAE